MLAAGVYLVLGLCLFLAMTLPVALRRYSVSAPMVLVGVGMLIGWSPVELGVAADPESNRALIERLTEVGVLIALMGVGLALDRPLDLRSLRSMARWSAAWRLLAVTMPLCIAGVALLGWGLGLAPGAAIVLAAVLAPTDPVLASDVQVGGPRTEGDGPEPTYWAAQHDGVDPDAGHEHDEVRFALTAEAGLNDGLAFPFVYLGLLVLAGSFGVGELLTWTGWYAVSKVAVGVAVGLATGWLIGALVFRSRQEAFRLADQRNPLAALATLLTAYGAAELVEGYGFLAVFAAAMTLRAQERGHRYHRAMHEVVERLERLVTLVVLLLLGISATRGLFDSLDWEGVLVGLTLVLLVRPLTGWLALATRRRPTAAVGGLTRSEAPVIAFFGIRGVGSLFYLAYAAGKTDLAREDWMWSTVAFTVVLSVMLHGLLATPVMTWLDRRRGWT